MPRRPARITVHFREIARHGSRGAATYATFAVELRQGRRSWTIGRVFGGGRAWEGLPVCGAAWSRRHATRRAATYALAYREDWRDPETHMRSCAPALSGALLWALTHHEETDGSV
jgi:hypothetical protein